MLCALNMNIYDVLYSSALLFQPNSVPFSLFWPSGVKEWYTYSSILFFINSIDQYINV